MNIWDTMTRWRMGRPEPGTPGQLYDASADPQEQNDLWEREPDIVARLSMLLDGYIDSGRSARVRGKSI